MAEITFEQVTKTYPDGTRAVSEVNLEIPDHKLVVLVGPSGCGKTTLLRMVAGLEQISHGTIRIGGRVINDVAPKQRDIAMVFQNYALYPHMSAHDNMAFGLKLRKVEKTTIGDRVRTTARTLALLEQLSKKPRHLSGGQRQRVAMGRAMVREPQAFLMDEPLSNLDAKLRVHMRAEIASLQRDLGVTTIYVTHDQTEAMTLGDLVAVIRLGVVQQVDEPQALYRRPVNLFVAGFIGSPAINLVEARLISEEGSVFVEFGGYRLRVDDAAIDRSPRLPRFIGDKVVVGIRPEHIEDASFLPDAPQDRRIRTMIELREEMGPETYVRFTADAPPVITEDIQEIAEDTDAAAVAELDEQASGRKTQLVARLDADTRVREGGLAELVVDTRKFHFFDATTGEAI